MMVPRSYMFSASVRSQSTERRGSKSSQVDSVRPRSTPPSIQISEPYDNCSAMPRKTSEPVSIPMHRSIRHGIASTALHTGRHTVGRSRRPVEVHDANSLPPAVAALLAVTAIPPPKRRQARNQSTIRRGKISIDELVQELRAEADQPSSLSNRSPLEILLEPADETGNGEESDDILVLDPDNEKDGCSTSPRSISSISLESIPSLDAANSTLETVGDACTPSPSPRKSPCERKEKTVCSPPKEAISLDEDPLRPTSPTEPILWDTKALPSLSRPTPKPKSTLTSNLTASLLALKTAAKSFSNFTAPSLPPDDLLTRSILSPATLDHNYPPEMRPKTISGVPDAALRRYMNPTTYAPSTKREDSQAFTSLSTSCLDFERAWRRA